DGFPDLVLWSESTGLQFRKSWGNAHHGLKLDLVGHRRLEPSGSVVRCNRDAVGTRVTAQTADFVTSAEYTTLSAGLGQARPPLILGMGRHPQAELLRLLWPDACRQAEFNIGTAAPGSPGCGCRQIEERNRKAAPM